MSDITESRELQRIKSDRDWFGYLTLENLDAVGERIRSLLTGRSYTWVALNGDAPMRAEVRAGQRLREVRVTHPEPGEGYQLGMISASDTYGVWGIHTATADQKAAHVESRTDPKRLTYVHLKHDRIEIAHYAIVGCELAWTVTVEPEDPRWRDLRDHLDESAKVTSTEAARALREEMPTAATMLRHRSETFALVRKDMDTIEAGQ